MTKRTYANQTPTATPWDGFHALVALAAMPGCAVALNECRSGWKCQVWRGGSEGGDLLVEAFALPENAMGAAVEALRLLKDGPA